MTCNLPFLSVFCFVCVFLNNYFVIIVMFGNDDCICRPHLKKIGQFWYAIPAFKKWAGIGQDWSCRNVRTYRTNGGKRRELPNSCQHTSLCLSEKETSMWNHIVTIESSKLCTDYQLSWEYHLIALNIMFHKWSFHVFLLNTENFVISIFRSSLLLEILW